MTQIIEVKRKRVKSRERDQNNALIMMSTTVLDNFIGKSNLCTIWNLLLGTKEIDGVCS